MGIPDGLGASSSPDHAASELAHKNRRVVAAAPWDVKPHRDVPNFDQIARETPRESIGHAKLESSRSRILGFDEAASAFPIATQKQTKRILSAKIRRRPIQSNEAGLPLKVIARSKRRSNR
jgi:hypothetical protein